MKGALIGLSLAVLTGCSTMSSQEKVWHTMHAVDIAQTINGPSNDPCYIEANSITRKMIGSKPHQDKVLIWGAAYHAIYHAAFKIIKNETLRTVMAVHKGSVVGANFAIGIKPFGENDCSKSNAHISWKLPF